MTAAARIELWLGFPVPTPAPISITEKLQSVEVTCNADGPDAFELRFHADRTLDTPAEFLLLSEGLLDPWTRVLIGVTLPGGSFTVLIDGFITHRKLMDDGNFAAATLSVAGEDVGIIMDRVEYSLEYPNMGDSAIALAVLAKYEMVGIVPQVSDTPADLVPVDGERTPQQNGTDRAYLRQLGETHGYRFKIVAGAAPLTNIAYWGPLKNQGAVAPPLSMYADATTNVEKLSFKLDGLPPVIVYGLVQDNETEEDAALATSACSLSPALTHNPVLDAFGLLQRHTLFTDPRLGYLQALVSAQAETDVSTDVPVTCDGDVDSLRYGAVIAAPGLIDVRGAGESYDGRYRVESVTHNLNHRGYRQTFRLAREGSSCPLSQVNV